MSDTSSTSTFAGDACLRLTLISDPAVVEVARQKVLEFRAPFSVTPAVLFNVELVLEETLMNLVHHAFDRTGSHRIEFIASLTADSITLHFEDEGVAFDPRLAPDPTLPTSLADAV